ncbi:MAG: M48 family metallopeptidase [Pseudomonadota bacterium]
MDFSNSTNAHYFDGDRPVAQRVYARVRGSKLIIEAPEMRAVEWPLEDIRSVPDGTGTVGIALQVTTDPLARLVVSGGHLSLPHLPQLNKAPRRSDRGRLALWAIAAIAAVALQIGVLIPLLANNLAGFIPARGERALGEATLGHIRTALDQTGAGSLPICEDTEGAAALDTAVARLMGDTEFRQELNVLVLDHPMVNAFALPGGFIVLFKGLIDAAESPDEVIAVLAHEIGHVISRDPARHALRSAGSIGILGLLFGDFAGGAAVVFLTERLISAQYSQEAEAGADAFAQSLLSDANINPGALADMFERLRDKHGDVDGVASHFLSHPALSERIAAAQAQVESTRVYTPSLTAAAWRSLQRICR